MFVYIYAYTYICVYVYTHTCLVYVYIHIHVCVYTYTHIYDMHLWTIMTALDTLQRILFVGVYSPVFLLGCSLRLDMLPLSDACSHASTGLPCIGGPRRR